MRPLVIQEPTLDLASEPKQTLAQICPIYQKKQKHLKQKYVLLDINSVCESGLSIYFFFKSDFRV